MNNRLIRNIELVTAGVLLAGSIIAGPINDSYDVALYFLVLAIFVLVFGLHSMMTTEDDNG